MVSDMGLAWTQPHLVTKSGCKHTELVWSIYTIANTVIHWRNGFVGVLDGELSSVDSIKRVLNEQLTSSLLAVCLLGLIKGFILSTARSEPDHEDCLYFYHCCQHQVRSYFASGFCCALFDHFHTLYQGVLLLFSDALGLCINNRTMFLASLFGFTHLNVSMLDILSGRSGKSANNIFIRKGKYVVFTPEPGVKFHYYYGSMEGQHTLFYV